jgi:hypothetical protein
MADQFSLTNQSRTRFNVSVAGDSTPS